jgi:hypothetical protein
VDVKEKRSSSKRCRYRSEKKKYDYCYSVYTAVQKNSWIMWQIYIELHGTHVKIIHPK